MSNQTYCNECERVTELDDSVEIEGNVYCTECYDHLVNKFRDFDREVCRD